MNTWDKSTAICDVKEIEDEGVDKVDNATSTSAIDITENDLDDGLERDRRGKIIRTCGIAGCQYRGRADHVKAHKAAKHGIDVIWFPCDQDGCEYKAKQAGHLKQHKQQVHNIDVQWHHCDQDRCDYKAKQAENLKRHKAIVHDIDVRWHHCDQDGCDYKAKQAVSIKLHKQNNHGIDVKWHRCDQYGCNYKAKEAGNLKRHRTVVHDIKHSGSSAIRTGATTRESKQSASNNTNKGNTHN